MQKNIPTAFGSFLSTYSREQAIADGVLIDITEATAEAGFVIPVAITKSAWDDFVAWTDQDNRRQAHQDVAGRLHDVVWTLRWRALFKRSERSRELPFKVFRVPRDT